jgi:hypothetical protein
MTLRRLPATLPLALLVAILAHALRFGGDHHLGGENGLELLWAVLAALAGLAVAAVLSSALAGAGGRRTAAVSRLLDALPGAGRFGSMACSLALSGAAAFAALEWSEGHDPLGGPWLVPALAFVALAVAGLVRLAVGSLARAGLALATCAPTLAPVVASFVCPAPELVAVRGVSRAGRRFGRAPPRFA